MNQKEVAIACLERLDIYKPYIRKFKSEAGTPCFFENFGGFYADQEEKLYSKIKEVESRTGCLVYAVTHEFFEFGETWSMLCVPRDNKGIDDVLWSTDTLKYFYAFAYVWNADYEDYSEFGDIVVYSFGGGIRRVS